MAIEFFNPNTIALAGNLHAITNDMGAGVAIKPGMLIETYPVSGAAMWRPSSNATNTPTMCVAIEQSEMNLGIDDLYSANDLVKAWWLDAGAVFYGIVPSGQNIAVGDSLQSNGDGKLKEASSLAASGGVVKFQSLDSPGLVNVDTRIRVQVIQ